jgi:hypothetical protein
MTPFVRSKVRAVALLPWCLGAGAMAQPMPPEAPRTLEWGRFADGGPAGGLPEKAARVSKPAVAAPVPVSVPVAASASSTASAREKTWNEVDTPAVVADTRSPPPGKVEDAAAVRPVPARVPAAGPAQGRDDGVREFFRRMVTRALALSPEVRQANAKWQAAEFRHQRGQGPALAPGASRPRVALGDLRQWNE